MITLQDVRKRKYRCRDVCSVWNGDDRDCEIYGHRHPSPVECPHFLRRVSDDVLAEREHIGFRCPFCGSSSGDDDIIYLLGTKLVCTDCGKVTLGINYVYDRRET